MWLHSVFWGCIGVAVKYLEVAAIVFGVWIYWNERGMRKDEAIHNAHPNNAHPLMSILVVIYKAILNERIKIKLKTIQTRRLQHQKKVA